MTDVQAALRRRIRLLLRAYPAGYRAEHGEAITGTMLDVAGPGRAWPTPREAGGVLLAAARVRARSVDLPLPTLLRDALQLAAIGLMIPLVVSWTSFLLVGGIPARDRFVPGMAPLLALAIAAVAGRYAAGVVLLAGMYLAQRWLDDLAVGSNPIVPLFPDEFFIIQLDLFATLLVWRLWERIRARGAPSGSRRAPAFSMLVVAVVTAVPVLLDATVLGLPEGGAPWWQYQLRDFAPYLLLLAFAAIDPRISMAGAVLAVLANAHALQILVGPDWYGRRGMVHAALVMGAALLAAAVLMVASLLARRRLTRL